MPFERPLALMAGMGFPHTSAEGHLASMSLHKIRAFIACDHFTQFSQELPLPPMCLEFYALLAEPFEQSPLQTPGRNKMSAGWRMRTCRSESAGQCVPASAKIFIVFRSCSGKRAFSASSSILLQLRQFYCFTNNLHNPPPNGVMQSSARIRVLQKVAYLTRAYKAY
jgi:hypothetical protein